MVWNAFLGHSFASRKDDTDVAALKKDFKHSLPIHSPLQSDLDASPLSEDIEYQIKKLPPSKQNTARFKVKTFRDAVQPHTDEGGDADYIGDCYGPVNEICHKEWSAAQEYVEPPPGLYLSKSC